MASKVAKSRSSKTSKARYVKQNRIGKNLFMILLLLLIIIGIGAYMAINSYKSKAAETNLTFIKMVDSRAAYGGGYAYAPSIVKKNGVYHTFFCSLPNGNNIIDFVRYTSSTDGVTWTAPIVKIKPYPHGGKDGNSKDISACDPSVVYYKGYYYLYYSDAYENSKGHWQTVIQVARSETIDGQYKVYTDRGTWEVRPHDAKILIYPFYETTNGDYGAGQETVVSKDGKLWMWYTDTSVNSDGKVSIFMLQSDDPVNWDTSKAKINNLVNQNSFDIKYDTANNIFILIGLNYGGLINSYSIVYDSNDGITWSDYKTLISDTKFPHFAHNSGFSGDEEGNLISNEPVLFSFGAPYGLRDTDVRGEWDLYGTFIPYQDLMTALSSPSSTTTPNPTSSVTPSPTGNNPPPIGVIDTITCANNEYIISGWACDTSMPTAALRVDFYSNGTLIKGDAAYRQREPAVGQQCGGNSNHGYTTTLPLLVGGRSVSAYAIGIDSNGKLDGNNILIGQQFAANCTSGNPINPPQPLTSGSPFIK